MILMSGGWVLVRAWVLLALWAGCLAGVAVVVMSATSRWRWKRRRRRMRRAMPMEYGPDLIRRGRDGGPA